MTLFETMMQAQNGDAMKMMARQFGLSEQQAESAIDALMPAFSTGLKRNASDPMGVGRFMEALSTGQHAKYFEDMSQAFQPQGVAEGNGILGHVFGSKEVSRAVAKQAAQATGIGQDILKQMLPIIASTLMGGMFKQSTEQARSAQTTGNPFIDMLTQMTQAQQGTQRPAPSANDNPFGQMLEQMMGGAQSSRSAPAAQNPWGEIVEQMMGAGQQASRPAPSQGTNPYAEMFGQMFETGRQTQETYQRGMEDIFNQYLEGMNRHR